MDPLPRDSRVPSSDPDPAQTAPRGPRPGELPHIAVIIPAYRAEDSIETVIRGLPLYVESILVVDDASPDRLAERVTRMAEPRVELLRHADNMGVGAATMTGYRRAVELGAEVMVKMDADGQMDPAYLPHLLEPILSGEVDYTKGNRFIHSKELSTMPILRRIGNTGLSFLSKMASGLWQIFDPTNGFTALHRRAFLRLDHNSLAPRYFFETSMLVELSLAQAVVRDVSIPARYGEEESNLSAWRSLAVFPPRLLRSFLSRIWVQHFVRNFGLFAIYSLLGSFLLVFGLCYGISNWIYYSQVLTGTAPVGTIMLSVLPIILGVQLVLQAVVIDAQGGPEQALQREGEAVDKLRAELSSRAHDPQRRWGQLS